MGYYTSFSLEIQGEHNRAKQFEKDLIEATRDENGDMDGEIKELIDYGAVYAKLYDIEDYIGPLAKKYPDLLIILGGDGEESDDIWETRWRGEECERQCAVIPPFTNPNLLTNKEKENNN